MLKGQINGEAKLRGPGAEPLEWGGVGGENDNRFQKYFCVLNAELLQQKMLFIQFQEPLAYGIQLLAKMILNLAESLNLLNLAMNIFKCQNLNPSYLEQKTTIVNLLR